MELSVTHFTTEVASKTTLEEDRLLGGFILSILDLLPTKTPFLLSTTLGVISSTQVGGTKFIFSC